MSKGKVAKRGHYWDCGRRYPQHWEGPLVVFMLDVNGFEVIDPGIDVPVQRFVNTIKETCSKVVGLSEFLTLAFDSIKETVDAIKQAGLCDKIKIMT